MPPGENTTPTAVAMRETLARRSRRGELAPQLNEEAFEREAGLHLELEGTPSLAHRLGRPLGSKRALGEAVLSKLGEQCGRACRSELHCGEDGICVDPTWADPTFGCQGYAPGP